MEENKQMISEKEYRQYLKLFFVISFIFLAFVSMVIIVVDPFFHYHKPISGLKAVQVKKEHQMVGVIDHLDYDSVLLGSSVVMNINNNTLDDQWKCRSIKVVGNSASASYLCWHLERAMRRNELKYVFYGYDIFSVYSVGSEDPLKGDGLEHMRNKNPFDDVEYLWNIDVLCEDVPYMIFNSLLDEYDEGTAYNFAQYSTFGREHVLESYRPEGTPAEMKPWDEQFELVRENLDLLKKIIEEHPNTEFKFFLPTYSILWWDRAYRQGMTEAYFYALDYSAQELLQYENVEFYKCDFNNVDVITNLDNYADLIHGSFETNEMMANEIGDKQYQLSENNYRDEIEKLRRIVYSFEDGWEREGEDFLNGLPESLTKID